MGDMSLEEMRTIWHQHAPSGEEARDDSTTWQDMLVGLKKYEQRIFRINQVKVLAGGLVLLFMWGFLLPSHVGSWLVLGGMGWITLSLLVFVVVYWRGQFRLNALPLERSTVELIQAARNGLSHERALFHRFMPLVGLAIVIGLQVMYLDLLQDDPWLYRLIYHGVSILAMGVALAGGLRFRQRRFDREMQPLVDQLNTLETSLKENGS